MDVEHVLRAARRWAGTATWAELRSAASRRSIESACAQGLLVRVARGRYALAATPTALTQAHALAGTASHESAAQLWMLETLHTPTHAHVTVSTSRQVVAVRGVRLHWSDLAEEEVSGRVTTPVRTVLDCARTLPFADGLAIADSALRRRAVDPDELALATAGLRGWGCARARRVVAHADGRAANPFESALRATVLDLGLTGFGPQTPFSTPRLRGQVDVGDPRRRVALEADSFAFHGSRTALDRDCRRYDELVRSGWIVLRFSWEQVMFDPDWVAATVEETLRAHSRW